MYLVYDLKAGYAWNDMHIFSTVMFLTFTLYGIFLDKFYIVYSEIVGTNIRHCMISLTEVQSSYLCLKFSFD